MSGGLEGGEVPEVPGEVGLVAEHLHAVYGFGTIVGDGLEEWGLRRRVVEVVEDYRLCIGNRERKGATRRSGIDNE